MKLKFSILTLISLFAVVLAGCTSSSNVLINCQGFSISGSAMAPTGSSAPLILTAYDSAGNAIFDGIVGFVSADPSNPSAPVNFTVGGTWDQTPVAGRIDVELNDEDLSGTCDPNVAQGQLPVFTDGRINPDPAATVVGYCSNGAIKVWAMVSDKWTLVGTVSKRAILDGLEKAVNSGQHVLLFEKAGQQVWALSSNELQFHNALGNPPYDYVFAGNRCG